MFQFFFFLPSTSGIMVGCCVAASFIIIVAVVAVAVAIDAMDSIDIMPSPHAAEDVSVAAPLTPPRKRNVLREYGKKQLNIFYLTN